MRRLYASAFFCSSRAAAPRASSALTRFSALLYVREMLDAPLTTGAVTDIAGRVGGAVGAGRSSHASVSITTVRESRTVRLTTHLRAMGGRRAATGGSMDTPWWRT